MVDDESGGNWYDHHLDDGEEHACHIDIHLGARIHIGQQGRQKRRKHGGDRGHAHGQGNIALGQVGHDIG